MNLIGIRNRMGSLAGLCALINVATAGLAVGDLATNYLPQLQAVYGGSIRGLDMIALTGSPGQERLFVSTEFSANSIFYADLDHSLADPFNTNNFSWHVAPDFDAQANFGTVNSIAGHELSGRLFVAVNKGVYSCTTNAGSLVTNIDLSGAPNTNGAPPPPPSGQFLAMCIHQSVLVAVASQGGGGSDMLYFGTLSADGTFTPGAGSPIAVGISGSMNGSDIGMEVNPANHCVYIIDSSGVNGIRKSSAPVTALSGAATFATITLPAAAASWQNGKRIGFGPEGRMFVGGSSITNYKVMAHSDTDGGSWTVVETGIGGTSGNNIRAGGPTNQYSVLFGGAISTNKGEAGSWLNLGYGGGPNQTHANDGAVAFDLLNERTLFCASDQGIAASTNSGMALFEIDQGLAAVSIQDLDMNAAKAVAWTASKSGIRRAANFQTAPQWTDAMFPLGNGAPYYAVTMDQTDSNGLTAYACNGVIYKTTDGGSNWVDIFAIDRPPYNTFGFLHSAYCSAIKTDGRNVVAGYYDQTPALGGLIVSADSGTNWTLAMGGVDVNDVLLLPDQSMLVALAYDASSGTGGIFLVESNGITHVMDQAVSIRNLDMDANGGIYGSGVTTSGVPLIFYKDRSSDIATLLTSSGLPATDLSPGGRGPVLTIGKDSSSNQVPVIAVGTKLYYLPSGAASWVSSAALTYPRGSQINTLYWDELMVGTSEGLYGQNLSADAPTNNVAGDFDGDHLADPAVVANGLWTIWMSGANYASVGPVTLSVPGGAPVVGDFDGDGRADPAMVANGLWTIWMSGANYAPVGPVTLSVPGGSPMAGDFDGDRLADPAMVAANGWTIWMSSAHYAPVGPVMLSVPGAPQGGSPVAGDFDGDAKADPAMVTANGWTIWMSGANYAPVGPVMLSVPGGSPMAGDFDGDAKADPAMVANGLWTIWMSGANYAPVGPILLLP